MTRHPYTYRNTQRGYVALMATIIISLVLLTMVVNKTFVGWSARFSVLDILAKEESRALAEGCVDLAIASIVMNAEYEGNTTYSTGKGECEIFDIDPAEVAAGTFTIKTRAEVRGATTNIEVTSNTWRETPSTNP